MFSRFDPQQLHYLMHILTIFIYFFMQTLMHAVSISTQNLCNKPPLKKNNKKKKKPNKGGWVPSACPAIQHFVLAQSAQQLFIF